MDTKAKKPRMISGLRVSALVETLVLLIALVFLDVTFGLGNRFIDLYPHPFWIVVLLITAQYGASEGLAAAFLATLFLYVGHIPGQLVEETTFDYQFRLSLRPFLWFSVSFILGELRTSQQNLTDLFRRQRDKATEQAKTISMNYEVLKVMKENLESRLVGQVSTIAATYETVRGLETLKPGQILTCLDKVVQTTLNPKKFSVFASGPNGLEAATSKGWSEGDSFKRRLAVDDPLYIEIVEKKRVVCIVNQEDEPIISGEGIVAGPLVERQTGEVFGMLKLEEIDFFRLDIGNLETFKTLCELIGSAYSNARKYRTAMMNSIYAEEGEGLFSFNLYALSRGFLEKVCKTANFPLSQLSVKLLENDELQSEQELAVISEIHKHLQNTLAEGTPIYRGKGGAVFHVLLPNMTEKEAENLSLKILSTIQENPLLADHRFKFVAELLYEPEKRAALVK